MLHRSCFPSLAGLIATVASVLAPVVVSAADAPVRKVTANGTATLKVVPDEMSWNIQVSINDTTLAKAKARHDASLSAALDYLKSLGVSIKDLQTGGIRIDKNYYADPSSEAGKKPFTCSTQVTFTLIDFDKYGPICDALAKLDGVEIQGVDYASSKEEETKREALKEALVNAHDKASDLAGTADCAIDKPLEIIEGGAEIAPRPMMMMARATSAPGTPDAVPGQIEFSASVTATYDLMGK